MRKLSCLVAAMSLALFCGQASAQFGFTLPGGFSIGGGGAKKGPDVGSMASNLVKAGREVSEEEEILTGQQFAAILLGASPLLQNPPVQRYVNTLGRWLASQTERPDLPWTFGVLDDEGFNAFATPGGYILITKGLLGRMRSEAELAGVLAHEIGHVVKKHHLGAMKKQGLTNFLAEGLSAAAGNDMLKNAALEFGRKILVSGLDKSDEYEADQLGVVIAARAGYDPYGLPSVLQMLQVQSGSDDSFKLMFDTHPSPADRLDRLGKVMNAPFETMPGSAGRPLADRVKEFSK
jgi:predicted Zn-dependent protease